jgi:hypothetical protein
VVHSDKIMQSMLARRPSEEDTDTKTEAQSAPTVESAPAQSLPPDPWKDPAEPILRKHGVDEETTASAWDIFHASKNSAELAANLQPLDIPNELKAELYDAKRNHDAAPTWHDKLDRAVESIKHLARLHKTSSARGGKSSIDTADQHPHVLAAFLEAQKKEE